MNTRVLLSLLFTCLLLHACTSTNQTSVDNPPVLIQHANQVLSFELKDILMENENVQLKGSKFNKKDSVVSQLDVVIKNVERVPLKEELPNLGKKIGIIVKTVLLDTNQYQQYKISFSAKEGVENPAEIVVLARDISSIPLNSSYFKEGALKR
ncbi:hypothetical protein VRU48_02480 [Pedobacter sp. KR3-3]|uniref:Lipoprotein n=1 Tax=Pedobacter albus TaxID=3113905 RepID=A0ABU7I3H6_9SPHI|nr:hypothetical protein [Pedobacter sp. KR3-3]MEE1943957.1 hypothetical protein [Pedobacter sp. KR3-3]